MNNLLEGLLEHDLDYLVMPLISIDEYESKIDDRKAIVVGFYVTDSEPAKELSAFIEKGVVSVLDTEVSPAPTEDGYYLVFVELDRDNTFIKDLLIIVDSIKNLTNIDDWEFSPYRSKEGENYPLTKKELAKHVNLDPESVEVKDSSDDDEEVDSSDNNIPDSAKPEEDLMTEPAEEIAEFLQYSLVDSIRIDENIMTLVNGYVTQRFEIVEFSNSKISTPFIMPAIGTKHLMESNRLQNMLGHTYDVYMTDGHLMVLEGDNRLLLKSVD